MRASLQISKRIVFAMAVVLSSVPAYAASGRILSGAQREKELVAISKLLAPVSESYYKRIDEGNNPFVRYSDVRQKKIIISTDVLSEAEALSKFSATFSPTGNLILGNRRALVTRGGNVYEGESFPININNQEFRVSVTEITRDYYILQLGTETIKCSYSNELR